MIRFRVLLRRADEQIEDSEFTWIKAAENRVHINDTRQCKEAIINAKGGSVITFCGQDLTYYEDEYNVMKNGGIGKETLCSQCVLTNEARKLFTDDIVEEFKRRSSRQNI